MFYPRMDEQGKQQFLCDLLCINSLDDITDNTRVFQDIEPAVSSREMRELAERVAGYNDCSLENTIYVVRNILNTVPKTLDDLIDYTTVERMHSFVQSVSDSLRVFNPDAKNVTTLEELEVVMEGCPTLVVDLICGEQMDGFSGLPEQQYPGITERQRMLYRAADYYLNHRVGYKTNTMWLACFISSQSFGCMDGWVHKTGELCNVRHFGFKDDDACVKLICMSGDFVDEFMQALPLSEIKEVEQEYHRRFEVAEMYIDTIIHALEYLTKERFADDLDALDRYEQLFALADEYSGYMNDGQQLRLVTVNLMKMGVDGFIEDQIQLMRHITSKRYDSNGPHQDILFFFDAWNFIMLGLNRDEGPELGLLFLQSRYYGEALRKMSTLLQSMLQQGGLHEDIEGLLKGFFVNYLYLLVNMHSDDFFLYPEILDVSAKASTVVDNRHIVRTMAELGYEPAQEHFASLK